MKWAAFAGLCTAIFSLGLLPLFAATKHPIAVLIVDGQSAGPYHDWQLTTQVLRKELAETALFQVTVATSPESGGDFSSFKPKFSDYAVIVWDYDARIGQQICGRNWSSTSATVAGWSSYMRRTTHFRTGKLIT